MFIYVALRGPRCPHTQQRGERVTAGHNTSHISCLSHMAVLAWPWFLPHLPSHLNPQSLFFQPVIGLRLIPYCVATSPQKPARSIVPCPLPHCHALITNLSSTQCKPSSYPVTFPPSHPPGSLSSSCQAWHRVTSGMENYYGPIPALPSIYSQMAC